MRSESNPGLRRPLHGGTTGVLGCAFPDNSVLKDRRATAMLLKQSRLVLNRTTSVFNVGGLNVQIHHWSSYAAARMGGRREGLLQRRRAGLRVHRFHGFFASERKISH